MKPKNVPAGIKDAQRTDESKPARTGKLKPLQQGLEVKIFITSYSGLLYAIAKR